MNTPKPTPNASQQSEKNERYDANPASTRASSSRLGASQDSNGERRSNAEPREASRTTEANESSRQAGGPTERLGRNENSQLEGTEPRVPGLSASSESDADREEIEKGRTPPMDKSV